jgi:glyoxylase I family protein
MEKVTGIGGFFFAATDPGALAQWYASTLGVDPAPESYEQPSWWQQAGATVVAPMPRDAEHLQRSNGTFAVTFRVADLDAMVAQVRGHGVEVVVDPTTYPNGRFADLADPEGNAVQLWEPAGVDLRHP